MASLPKIGMKEFATRRSELMALMEGDSIAILPSARVATRNNDVEYAFRQNSDFHYLTGFDEPDAVFVLVPGREHGEAILFCRERDEEFERWHGTVTGPERARQLYGLDDAFPISDIDDILPGLIEGKSKLYYAMGVHPEFDSRIIGWVKSISSNKQSGTQPPGEFIQLDQYLHELRLFKSAREVEVMKQSAAITADAHRRAMARARPGMREFQLEAELHYAFAAGGARSGAYPAIVGSGKNACILHYTSNNDPLRDGDLVLIDAGSEYEYYAADVTRTFPVNGKFTTAQRAVYDLVLSAQEAAIDMVRPGNQWNQPHDAAVRELTRGLVALGLLEGDVDELIEEEAYRKFYMHKTGHWLGLDVHDVGEYKVGDEWRVFEPGMVTTIEPGLYIADDLDGVPAKYKGIGIRIEDNVLVTRDGNEILTASIPRTPSEIETLMADSRKAES